MRQEQKSHGGDFGNFGYNVHRIKISREEHSIKINSIKIKILNS